MSVLTAVYCDFARIKSLCHTSGKRLSLVCHSFATGVSIVCHGSVTLVLNKENTQKESFGAMFAYLFPLYFNGLSGDLCDK